MIRESTVFAQFPWFRPTGLERIQSQIQKMEGFFSWHDRVVRRDLLMTYGLIIKLLYHGIMLLLGHILMLPFALLGKVFDDRRCNVQKP